MDIEAFILIGGKSSRFGRDKATFLFEGTTLTERTAETIRNAFPSAGTTLVAADDAQFSAYPGLGHKFPFIFDTHKGRGPLGAIHAALAHARTDWAFIVACDFPFISSGLLRRLAGVRSSEDDAIIPIQPDGMIQPLCGLWRVERCLPVVSQILESSGWTPSATSVLEQIQTRLVPFGELADLPGAEKLFVNINKPSDLAAPTLISDSSV